MQYSGSAETAFAMAMQQGIALTDDLETGALLPKPRIMHPDIVELYRVERCVPCSILYLPDLPKKQGIGYWIIGLDFKVSKD